MRRAAGGGSVAATLLLGAALGCRQAPLPDACLEIDAPSQPIGFDTPFSVVVRRGCPELAGGKVAWRQVAGPPLHAFAPGNDGFMLAARMPPLADLLGGPVPWGVIPLSPRTRGEVTLEATWSDGRGRTLRREVRMAAAPRSRGLPNTPIATRVYLGGEDWRVLASPPGSTASLERPAHPGGVASLSPDISGDFLLADGRGRQLTLRSAGYGETLLDCGRSGCHAAITDAAARSPMTSVLARGMFHVPGAAIAAFGPGYPDCALACHATGEPGLADGGFTNVATELGVTGLDRRRWEDLPRALRRLGGVGCLACHGPAALPPRSARWTLLRSDVCATCHDAPPRYGHVAAWRTTGMSRADRDSRAATDRACARCHTTWGFLGADPATRRPPAEAGPVGIGCAACHAVHDPGVAHDTGGGQGALLRAPPMPALLAGTGPAGRSAVCLGCHTPDPGAPLPAASAAALVAGRGGIDPASGRPLDGAPSHAGVPGGCIGCHRAGRAKLGMETGTQMGAGAGHGFAVARATCTPCHPQPPAPSDLAERARRLWETWRGTAPGTPGPAHAGATPIDRGTPVGRAAWNVLMVLEDPAAATHNAPYARALLASAEPVILAARQPAPTRKVSRKK